MKREERGGKGKTSCVIRECFSAKKVRYKLGKRKKRYQQGGEAVNGKPVSDRRPRREKGNGRPGGRARSKFVDPIGKKRNGSLGELSKGPRELSSIQGRENREKGYGGEAKNDLALLEGLGKTRMQ